MGEGVMRIEGDHIVSEVKDINEVIPIRLNEQEKALLKDAKRILEQPKDSTALKQLVALGYKCIKKPESEELLELVFANKRKNKRSGIIEFEV